LFLVQHRFKFLGKTMPTQGVGFLTRKINHRSTGVKGLLKKFRGYGYLAFHFRNGKGCHRKLIERTKNRNHKPDRIAYCIRKYTIKNLIQWYSLKFFYASC